MLHGDLREVDPVLHPVLDLQLREGGLLPPCDWLLVSPSHKNLLILIVLLLLIRRLLPPSGDIVPLVGNAHLGEALLVKIPLVGEVHFGHHRFSRSLGAAGELTDTLSGKVEC